MDIYNHIQIPDNYVHKKFDKRKRCNSDMDYNPLPINNSLQSISSHSNQNSTKDDSSSDGFLDRTPDNDFCSTPQRKRRKINCSLKEQSARNLLQIPKETILEICKYHPNMARYGPTKIRTPKDQERRNKNTIACRKTRRVKKLEEIAQWEQYKKCNEQYLEILREKARANHYIEELLKLTQMRLYIFGKLQ